MRVWVTRDESDDGPLATALRGHQLQAVVEPVVDRRVLADPAELLAGLTADDWLVLTSPFAIEAVSSEPKARIPQVAVVGEASRDAARRAGLRVSLVGEDGHGQTLFAQLRERVTTGSVCYPRSGRARTPEAWGQVTLRAPVLYDTYSRAFDRSVVDRVDLAALASPSAAKAIREIELPLASIGRTTTAAIEAMGRSPVVEPQYPTFENLAAAIADYVNDSRHQRA